MKILKIIHPERNKIVLAVNLEESYENIYKIGPNEHKLYD